MDDLAMLWFLNNATPEDWKLFSYTFIAIIIVASVGLLCSVIHVTYVSFKNNKKRKTALAQQVSERNIIWVTNDGRRIMIKNMDDHHVANIIDFLNKYPIHPSQDLIPILKKELELRGIKQEFADRSQIPYKNKRGKWEIWNFVKNCPMELQN